MYEANSTWFDTVAGALLNNSAITMLSWTKKKVSYRVSPVYNYTPFSLAQMQLQGGLNHFVMLARLLTHPRTVSFLPKSLDTELSTGDIEGNFLKHVTENQHSTLREQPS